MSKIQSDTEHLILNADGSGKEVRFQNNGTQNVVIDSSGNVGIGTASPSSALDVTGTVTADGLTVDANTATFSAGTSGDMQVIIEADTDNNNEGDSPSLVFKQDGGVTIGRIGLNGNANDAFTGAATNSLYIGNDESAYLQLYTDLKERLRINHTGNISFYEDTGATPKFFWDASAESLGIGTSSLITTSGRSSLTISTANEKGHLNLQNRTATTASDAGIISFYNGSNPICNISVMADGATNSGRLIFQTYNAGTPVRSLDIDKNGDVQFKNSAGNVRLYWDNSAEGLVSSGAGISFDAGSNYLDDYEEGGFTATLRGSTGEPSTLITADTAYYTKIGNTVFYSVSFENESFSSYSGDAYIQGLPFTSYNVTHRHSGTAAHYNALTHTSDALFCMVEANNTAIRINYSQSGTGWAQAQHSSASSSCYIWCTGSYFTDS